jgi:hypothetical protein
MQQTLSDRAKSIVGVLSGKLDHTTIQFNHFLGTIVVKAVVKALWVLPTAIFEVSRGLQAHIVHQQRFLDGSFRHTFVPAYIGIVLAGGARHRRNSVATVLSSDACPKNIERIQEKIPDVSI